MKHNASYNNFFKKTNVSLYILSFRKNSHIFSKKQIKCKVFIGDSKYYRIFVIGVASEQFHLIYYAL
jgi:hypothetical protein